MGTDEHQRHQKKSSRHPRPPAARPGVDPGPRRATLAELRAGGLTRAQVAEVLGVSPGRVAQLEPSSTASLTTPTSPLTEQSPQTVGETGRDAMQEDGNL